MSGATPVFNWIVALVGTLGIRDELIAKQCISWAAYVESLKALEKLNGGPVRLPIRRRPAQRCDIVTVLCPIPKTTIANFLDTLRVNIYNKCVFEPLCPKACLWRWGRAGDLWLRAVVGNDATFLIEKETDMRSAPG